MTELEKQICRVQALYDLRVVLGEDLEPNAQDRLGNLIANQEAQLAKLRVTADVNSRLKPEF